MKKIEFGNETVVVDIERTKDLYDLLTKRRPGLNWCQCDDCTNTRMVRHRFMPEKQIQLLYDLGLNPRLPFHSGGARGIRPVSKNYYGWDSMWYLYASFERSKPSPRITFENKEEVWIDESEHDDEVYARTNNYPSFDMNGLVLVRASNVFPWLYDQVDCFKSEQIGICPDCGFGWKEVGFLKKESLIPEWYDLPEISSVLQTRKKRVKVSLCSRCGHLDYEVTKG